MSAIDSYNSQVLLNDTAQQFRQSGLMSTLEFDDGALVNENGKVSAVIFTPSNATERMLAKYRQITGDTKMTSNFVTTEEGMKNFDKAIRPPDGSVYIEAKKANKEIFEYLKS